MGRWYLPSVGPGTPVCVFDAIRFEIGDRGLQVMMNP